MKKNEDVSLSHLPANFGFICAGYPVPPTSEMATEAEVVAGNCHPPLSYSLSLNLNILKVNTLTFTCRF